MNRKANDCPSINTTDDEALVETFIDGIGSKVLILTPSYPFLFIGEILDVIEDAVEVCVEVTQFSQLENRNWFIHIHNIEVFYIEQPGQPRIPELDDLN